MRKFLIPFILFFPVLRHAGDREDFEAYKQQIRPELHRSAACSIHPCKPRDSQDHRAGGKPPVRPPYWLQMRHSLAAGFCEPPFCGLPAYPASSTC